MFAHYRKHRSPNPEFQRWLDSKYWPLAGREGEEEKTAADLIAEAQDDDLELPDNITEDSSVEDVEAAITAAREAAEAKKAETDDNDDDDPLAKLQNQLAKKDAELTAAQAAARNAKREARDARKKAAEDNGDWERVANETRAELEETKEKLEAAETERDQSRTALDSFQREVRVTRIASRLGYRDPADAIALLSNDDTGDDKSAERALRKLAQEKDYLVDQRKASGRAMNGNNGTGLLTKEQMDAMSTQEINDNWDIVQKSMAALGSGTGT